MTLDDLAASLGLEPKMFATVPGADGRYAVGSDPTPGWVYLVDTHHPLGAVIIGKWTAQDAEQFSRLWQRATYTAGSGIGDMR